MTDTPVVPPTEPAPTEHTDSVGQTAVEEIPDHPARQDSEEYVKSRVEMNKLAPLSPTVSGLLLDGTGGTQDHHGGSLWAWSGDNVETGEPFMVKNLVGIEWSAQWCADPAKVNLLRQNAALFYAMFPNSAAALGIVELLATPITDAAGVAAWTDSICNAGVPLPATHHTGEITSGGHAGVHNYPTPVAEIEFFKHADFTLWVPDENGQPMAVTPVSPRGSGDGTVEVQWAHPNSAYHAAKETAHAAGERFTLPPGHQASIAAFANQTPVTPLPPPASTPEPPLVP